MTQNAQADVASASRQPDGSAGRWWAMAAISVSVLVVGLDLTVLSLALPTIAARLHAGTGDLQWITDSYSLVIAALILPAGLLGDRYGRKRMLLAALAIFVASSVWCAYSTSTGELIAARAALGIGAAAVFPMALSVIPVMFGEHERQKALTLMAGAVFVSYPIGPILGGFLLNHFWWGSVFLINVPIVAIALAAVTFLLPESRADKRPSLDVAGIAISSAGLAALTFGFIRSGQNGWSDTAAVTTMAAGAVVLALFVAWERLVARRTGGQSLVDLPLFGIAGFRWGTILMTLVSFAMFGLMFAAPLYFQEVRAATPLGSGIRLLPMIGGMVVGMVAGSRLSDAPKGPDGRPGRPKVSARAATGTGFAAMAVGLAMGALTGIGSSTGYAAAWIAVTGFGLGLAMPPAMNAAVGPLSEERSGAGSALISAVRQVGATIGVAVLGTVISNGYRSRLSLTGLPEQVASAARGGVSGGVAVAHKLNSATLLGEVRTAFIHGMDVMLWTCAGIAVAGALMALAFLPRRAGLDTAAETPQDAPREPADPGAPASSARRTI
ncbi:MFS transporter [Actinocrinis puniceicyclus]|uniref:MFS transporter n=1 Tax=Actinocrinis puniceicyclus TaxID=977794 RepID=A0A8J7WVT5_9ACTN|nr:MFS transporter [Actinocrinis puniceicyclus]MBS2966780.1 MFS transporter [Actinocrinis puniceicyclus]